MKTVPVQRDDLSFWVNERDPLPCPALHGEVTADVAIVGGGFTGLSAAYHFAREHRDRKVVLVEAHAIGSGASGRNTGILRPGVGGTVLDLARRYGEAEAGRLYRLSIGAVEHVKDMICREQIDCDLEEVAHVKAALTSRQARLLEEETAMLDRLGIGAEYLDAARMAAATPIRYRAGLSYPQGGQLNPALLCRHLKRILLDRGVHIYEGTSVRSFTPGKEVRLDLAHGTLRAGHAILATNGYAAHLGVLAGQVIPLHTHVSVTEPLRDAQLARLAWQGRRSFSDRRNIFNYYRLTRDNRILFGGGRPAYRGAHGNRSAGAVDIAAPKVMREQHRLFMRDFPGLPTVRITHQWSGTLGMTLDHLPVVGELAVNSGVFFAGGWNGHGVALAIAGGALVADLVCGRAAGEAKVPWQRSRAPRVPGDPLRGLGLSAYLAGLQLADRLEAVFDRCHGIGIRA